MFENAPSCLTDGVFSSRGGAGGGISTISTRCALVQTEKAVRDEKTNTNVVAQVVVFFSSLSFNYTSKEEAAENHIARNLYRQITQAAGRRRRPVSMIRSAAGENKRHSGRVLPPPSRAPGLGLTVCRSAAGGGSARVPARRLSPRLEVGGSLNVFQTG